VKRPPSGRAAVLRSDLRAIQSDGVAFSVMVGSGEAYLAAFALALGLGDRVAGLVAAVPVLVGAVLQLVSPVGVRKLRSHRRWVVTCAAVQAASFLPLTAGALVGVFPAWALLVVAGIYWGAGMGTGPAWNTWVGELVPRSVRARFFAHRARRCQIGLLIGLLGAGLLLDYMATLGLALLGFAAAFTMAGLARVVSAVYLWRQSEPARLAVLSPAETPPRLRDALVPTTAKLLVFMLALQFSVHLAAPYFTPYMLGPLGLSYAEYVSLIAASFVAKMLVAYPLGFVARYLGARRLLAVAGLAIAPLSGLWIVSDHLGYLFALQIMSGAAWAAYELATVLLFFEAIPVDRRTRLLTLFNLVNAIALVGGAAAGALLLSWLGFSRDGYLIVFLASSALRLVSLLLVRLAHDVPLPEVLPVSRALAARPSSGSLERPVLPGLDT
jgi:MFS family permease